MKAASTIDRCTKCIMPASYPEIHFDKNRVSNYCANHTRTHGRSSSVELAELFRSRPKSGEFDCLVPVSGGKDSMFVLYYAVKILKLRVLAVNYDSGFQSNLGSENVRNACAILEVPLISIHANERRQKKMLRTILSISSRIGTYYHICGNCEVALRACVINTARKNNIQMVLWGGSSQENSMPDNYLSKQMGKRRFIKDCGLAKVILDSPSRSGLSPYEYCPKGAEFGLP